VSASQVLRFSVLCEYILFTRSRLLQLHHRQFFFFFFLVPYSSSPFSSFFAFIFSVLIFFFSILFLAPYCIPPFSCFSSHFTFLFLCLASSVSLLILFVTPLTLIHILLSLYHLLFPRLFLVPIHHLSHYPTSFLLFPFFLISIHHFISPLLLFISLYYNLFFLPSIFPSLICSYSPSSSSIIHCGCVCSFFQCSSSFLFVRRSAKCYELFQSLFLLTRDD